MFDAHTHLQDRRIAPVLDHLMAEARAAGVTACIACGTSPSDWADVETLAKDWACARPAFGVHPWYAGALPSDWVDRLKELLLRYPRASVGEVGLDAIRKDPDAATQRQVLVEQLTLAATLGKVVSLHAVRCVPDVLAAVRPFADRLPGFLVHSFSASAETVRELARLGGYASFGGTLLNPNARHVHEAVTAVPLDRLLAETDAPDMLPVGGRVCANLPGTNHPANLALVVAELARRRGLDSATMTEVTARNATRLFDG